MLIPEKQLQKKINSENQLYIIKINVFKLQNYFFKLFTPEPLVSWHLNPCSRLPHHIWVEHWGLRPPLGRGSWTASNTMWPGPRPTCIPEHHTSLL